MRRFALAAVALASVLISAGVGRGAAGAAVAPGCDHDAIATSMPPAALPPPVAAAYPNGAEVTVTVTVDAAGKASAATSNGPAGLRPVVTAWAKRVAFAPAAKGCKPVASSLELEDVDFYPAASGVVGRPKIVNGVDFDNLTYTNGPGNCATSAMRNGSHDDPEGEYTASVEDVFAGAVAGVPAAVVILRCEYNGHGFDSQAQLFALAGGTARRLGILGAGGMMSSDSVLPPWPGGWIHVSFAGGNLYADVWDGAHQCDAKRDWVTSTYSIRNGKLTLLDRKPHHRNGLPLTCER